MRLVRLRVETSNRNSLLSSSQQLLFQIGLKKQKIPLLSSSLIPTGSLLIIVTAHPLKTSSKIYFTSILNKSGLLPLLARTEPEQAADMALSLFRPQFFFSTNSPLPSNSLFLSLSPQLWPSSFLLEADEVNSLSFGQELIKLFG